MKKTSQPDLFARPSVAARPPTGAVLPHRPAFVRVMVPMAVPAMLDYRWVASDNRQPAVGAWVEAPLGRKTVHGVVTELLAESMVTGLKDVTPLDVPLLDEKMVEFYRWVARYTLSAPGEPLRVALPRAMVPEAPEKVMGLQATLGGIGKLTPLRTRVLELLGDGIALPAELAKRAGVGASVVKGLEDNGWLQRVGLPDDAWLPERGPKLSPDQAVAVDLVQATDGFKPWLLDGVTGSGKTEVYFTLIDKVLQAGGQALLLVPEIALTPQLRERVKERFGRAPMVWHSGEAAGRKAKTWWHVVSGRGGLVVGARSALFLPWQDLQLVLVDEEHDPSYKQDEAFRYHGRDMAIQLARLWQCPVVLGSATPSFETWQAALDGRYGHLILPNRQGGAALPAIELVDLRAQKPEKGDYLSARLRAAIGENLAKKEQTLLFLNRRGVAPVLMCTACGHRRDCPRCDATLVVHGDRLMCHHCGYTEARSHECPQCKGQINEATGEINANTMQPYGPGTRRVATEAMRLFPDARVVVADSDSVGTTSQLEALMDEVKSGQADIIVGTQMVTKGHHVPNLTLVGVVDGDMGLTHGDLRAAERTWQVLQQVAGRAGRAEKPGRVIIQTHEPNHALFQTLLLNDRDAFYATELAARQAWGDPPFGRQMALVVEGLNEQEVIDTARELARMFGQYLTSDSGHRLLGPAPAPLARRNERWRWRLLIKAPRLSHALLKQWLESCGCGKGVQVKVDVDPVSFM